MTQFISVIRAIVEMLGLCLIAQALLYVLAGQHRDSNPIYRFFELMTRAPQALVAVLLPLKMAPVQRGVLSFILLFICWLGLAYLRKLF